MGMIQTIHGETDEALLQKRTGELDNENELTSWTEYWFGGSESCAHTFDMHAARLSDQSHACLTCNAKLVKRDVNMHLKKLPVMAGAATSFK